MLRSIGTYALALAGPGTCSPANLTSVSPTSPQHAMHRRVRTPSPLAEKRYPSLGLGLPGDVRGRKVRVAAALGGYKPTGRESASVFEVDNGDEASADTTDAGSDSSERELVYSSCSAPLSSARRTHRRNSASEGLSALIGSVARAPAKAVISPIVVPHAPRIPFPPLPTTDVTSASAQRALSATRNAGLGLDITNMRRSPRDTATHHPRIVTPESHSDVTSPLVYTDNRQGSATTSDTHVGLGITLHGIPLCQTTFAQSAYPIQSGHGHSIAIPNSIPLMPTNIGTTGQAFAAEGSEPETGEDEEEAYYHLPSDLFSPEITMSTAEFTSSVRTWVERRQEARKAASVPNMHAKL